MFNFGTTSRYNKQKSEAGITASIISTLAKNLRTTPEKIHKRLDDAFGSAGGELSMSQIFHEIFVVQERQRISLKPEKMDTNDDNTTRKPTPGGDKSFSPSVNSMDSSISSPTLFQDAIELPTNVVNTEDPLAFINALWGEAESNLGKSNKSKKNISNDLNLFSFQARTDGSQEQPTAFDQTSITRGETILKGHFMIPMSAIQKYFCTHCLGTIDERLVHDHKSKCFNTKPGEYSSFYCPCCNAKNTSENCDAHFNSAKHASRMAYIKELIRMKSKIYVNATGVSHVSGSTTSQNGDKVDLEFLVERIRLSEFLYNKYKISGGKQLFRLMNSIIQNKEHGNDELAVTLAQRNAIVKTYLNYLAEVNGQRVLCHPAFDGESEDFIRVQNCADALKEINIDIISRNNKIDEATKMKQKAQIDQIFGQTIDATRVAKCHICGLDHAVKYYTNSAALCKMIQLMINQLKK